MNRCLLLLLFVLLSAPAFAQKPDLNSGNGCFQNYQAASSLHAQTPRFRARRTLGVRGAQRDSTWTRRHQFDQSVERFRFSGVCADWFYKGSRTTTGNFTRRPKVPQRLTIR